MINHSKRTQNKEEIIEQIKRAFLSLVVEQAYDDFTMQAVAESAEVSRATLYRYYTNKEALLLACFSESIERLKQHVVFPSNVPQIPEGEIAYHNILTFYELVAENQPLFRALLCSSATAIIRPQLRRLLVGHLLIMMQQVDILALLPAPADVIINLVAEMQIGALIWWLENEQAATPELLSNLIIRLMETGLFGLTGRAIVSSDMSATPFNIHQFNLNSLDKMEIK